MTSARLFPSFFIAGFECSTQRRRDGRRLDLITATRHDRFAAQDYALAATYGLSTVRDGLRWHLIERAPGRYDWSSFLPMLEAANEAKVQVIWDLCHYGWPDDLDIWSSRFVDRFARFARETARVVRDQNDVVPYYCPVNEISFWAWAACDAGRFEPLAKGRAGELKRQLVRAAIAAIEAVWEVDRRARIIHSDPVINVIAGSQRKRDRAAAAAYHDAQHEARDMLAGRLAPELGGRPEYLDVIGVNYYSDNQWILGGPTVEFGSHRYRPLRELLAETWRRYQRPIVITETGAEGSARAAWLFYVAAETRAALADGARIEGICLYPILEYPGWEDDRACETGLFGCADDDGRRNVYEPLAEELERQRMIFETLATEFPPRLKLVGSAD